MGKKAPKKDKPAFDPDEILRRMLNTPPEPKVKKPGEQKRKPVDDRLFYYPMGI